MLWGTTWLDAKVNGRLLSPQDIDKVMDRAINTHGLRFFDTAEGYGGGTCEVQLGASAHRVLTANTSVRDLYLATKFLPYMYRWGELSVVRAIEASNRRMGVDCCELYFLHSPVHPLPLETWVRGAARAYREGKIRAFGLSNCDAAQVERAHCVATAEGLPLVANQILFNLMVFKSPELQRTLEVCSRLRIRVVAYSPLGQGLLCKPGLTAEEAKGIRLLRVTGTTFGQLTPLRDSVADIARRLSSPTLSVTPAQVCIAWVKAKGAVPLVGIRTVPQLDDIMGAMEVTLAPDDVALLDDRALGHHTFGRRRFRRAFFITLIQMLVTTYRLFAWLERSPLARLFSR